jgi:two-component system KDP operon response regulator KdpE
MTAEQPLVLVVEDEPQLRQLLRVTLTANGYRCAEAPTAREGNSAAENHRPDLVIADLGLPDGDGIELIRRLRKWSAMPVIVLSARSHENDKIAALDAGADDYVTKPFNSGELLARLRVALRHAAQRSSTQKQETYQVKDLHVDLLTRRVTVRGVEVHLTPIEYRLLNSLIRKAGHVITHKELMREVWGPGKQDQAHYLRIYMKELRRKLEEDSARPVYLLTEVGVGYRLTDE